MPKPSKIRDSINSSIKTPDPSSKADDPEFLWNVETMTAVIEAKKQSRNEKGETMNCFVVKTDSDDGDELIKLLDKIKAHLPELEGQRFQIACQSSVHWWPIDMQVKNGKLQAIVMEAGFSPCTPSTINKIKSRFPDSDVYALIPDEVKIGDKMRTRMLQADNNSCSRFTLEHIFHMQRHDMFALFDQHKASFAAPPPLPANTDYKNISQSDIRASDYEYYHVTLGNMPKEAAFLFRDTQSLSIIKSLSDELKSMVINKKGETLLESVERHTEASNQNVRLNKSVVHFRDSKGQETVDFIAKKSNAELTKMMDKRDGTAFVTGGKAYRNQETQQQLAKQKPYPEILKAQTEKVKTAISEYTREVSATLNQIKKQNPDNVKLIAHVDNMLQLVENLRIQGLNTKGNSFYQLEKQLKNINASMGILHDELLKTRSDYVVNINHQTIKELKSKFDAIKDSLVNFHNAEKQHAKASDTAQLVMGSVTKVFRSNAEQKAKRNPVVVSYINAKTRVPTVTQSAGVPKAGIKSEAVQAADKPHTNDEGSRKGNKI